jgi:hypothetical protein
MVLGGLALAIYGAVHLLEQLLGGEVGAFGSRDVKLVFGGAVLTGLLLLSAAVWRKYGEAWREYAGTWWKQAVMRWKG